MNRVCSAGLRGRQGPVCYVPGVTQAIPGCKITSHALLARVVSRAHSLLNQAVTLRRSELVARKLESTATNLLTQPTRAEAHALRPSKTSSRCEIG